MFVYSQVWGGMEELYLEIAFAIGKSDITRSDHEYYQKQTERFGLQIMRDIVARQTVGHSDFSKFSGSDWEVFYNRYRLVIAEARLQSRMKQW